MKCFNPDKGRLCHLMLLLLLTSLVAFLFLTMYLAHLHVLPDGRVVLHSHALPFNSKGGSHHHSITSLLFSAIFAHGVLMILAAFLLWHFRRPFNELFSTKLAFHIPNGHAATVRLRAPPVVLF